MDSVVEINDVSKKFGEAVVLNHISLALGKGKIYGLVGRNGSGKTMLMKCILGFVIPDSGSVRVFGKSIGREMEFAENTGFIIEHPGFLPQYTGYQNLKLLSNMVNTTTETQIRSALESVGLEPDSRKKVGKYSMGMMQRLGIAQAFIENPGLIILDEPFNGLDNDGVAEIRELFCGLREQGKTILLSSHNKEDIEILCDEVYMMDQGRMERKELEGAVLK